MKGTVPLKPWDGAIFVLALFLTVASAFAVYLKPRNALRVLIQGRDHQWVFPLDAHELVAVPGPLGDTTIRIRDGRAWVESSPCDNQSCAAAGPLYQSGAWAACLPNHVFLIIEGYDGGDLVDAASW